jgi:predicted Rossmann-fold nucleotide-binding protein
LIDWMKTSMLVARNISLEDLDLMHVVDDPDDVCAIINKRYKDRLTGIRKDRRDKARKGI